MQASYNCELYIVYAFLVHVSILVFYALDDSVVRLTECWVTERT